MSVEIWLPEELVRLEWEVRNAKMNTIFKTGAAHRKAVRKAEALRIMRDIRIHRMAGVTKDGKANYARFNEIKEALQRAADQ